MRLLHLVHTPRHSGAEMLVRDLCLRHVQNGVACAFAAFDEGTPEFAPELELLRAAGVEVFAPRTAGDRLGRLQTYVRAIRAFGPDAIFGHSLIPAAYGRVAAVCARSRARFVKVLHSSSDDYQSFQVRFMERLLHARTDGIITVAPAAADHYRRNFHKTPPIIHVANGINLEPIYAACERRAVIRAGLGLSPADRLLLQVGRIAAVKNQRLTLAALTPLMHADPSLHLWFAGVVENADYYQKLKVEIESSGLGAQVNYLGARSDVPDLLAAADVYLMPSESEAHSVAFLEALASGAPVVASDIPAFAFAEGMDGVCRTRLDQELLQGAVTTALASSQRTIRNMSKYSADATAAAYENVARG